jgi:hypothetical protein
VADVAIPIALNKFSVNGANKKAHRDVSLPNQQQIKIYVVSLLCLDDLDPFNA